MVASEARGPLTVRTSTRRRAATIVLQGELDLGTVEKHTAPALAGQHNLAVVRGPAEVQRLIGLTDVSERFIMVDDPYDLVPPQSGR